MTYDTEQQNADLAELLLEVLKRHSYEVEGDPERADNIGFTALKVLEIYEGCEVPFFGEIPDVTSTTNDAAVRKYWYLEKIDPLKGLLFPQHMVDIFPITPEPTKEDMLVPPWVNIIHGWIKVLNLMNEVHVLQMNEVSPDIQPEQVLASISYELYRFTTEYNDLSHLRHVSQYTSGIYTETAWRGHGILSINPGRHINRTEMLEILDTFGAAFARPAPSE